MQEHGTGRFGILVTWKNSRKQTKYWSPTETERDRDFQIHDRMPEVRSVVRIKR